VGQIFVLSVSKNSKTAKRIFIIYDFEERHQFDGMLLFWLKENGNGQSA
jgi:hypothetical protein